jgi:predicted aspartyl protease
MQDFGGRPIVDVRVNGKGPYRFILDTGASMTVIDAALKAELKLPTMPGMRAAAPGHGPAPEIVSVDSLSVGGARLRGVTAALMPLGAFLTGEQAPRGVLSASVFPGHLVTFDYPSRRIVLKRGALERADSTTTHAYGEDDPLPTVPIRIAGREMRVHLDTGSSSGLMLPARFLEELPLASKPQPGGTAKMHGGEVAVTKARVDGPIAIGRYTLDLAEVSFADLKPGFGPPRGNIGFQVLRQFVVTLDSRNRLVRLAR